MTWEVSIHMAVIDEEPKVFVHRVDRTNKRCESLNHKGEWQQASLYKESPPETMFTLYGYKSA